MKHKGDKVEVSNNRQYALRTAEKLINADRNRQHGEPEDSFGNIAALWTWYKGVPISRTDVAVMMALFKMARLEANPKNEDNWFDALGYLACGYEIMKMEDG